MIVAGDPVDSFLLMQHDDRWDLPKGHVDPGETDLECALRELEEETGFTECDLWIDPNFRFEHRYFVSPGRYTGWEKDDPLEKTLLIFLARLPEQRDPDPTEHIGFRWFQWKPPHRIQQKTIDPLLAQVADHLHADRNGTQR